MLEEEYALPRAEHQSPCGNRYGLAGARQNHAEVRSGVVGTFIGVDVVVLVFRNESLEKRMQIGPSRRIGIFVNDEARTGVLDKHRGHTRRYPTLTDHSGDLVGDFVGTLAFGGDGERGSNSVHFVLF